MRQISTARILISNDDGIRSPGIDMLERVARQFTDDVWVIAPEEEQSGAGHSLTLAKALRIRQLEEKRWAVSGTPTDCVMMAVNKIMKDALPTLILSGVNRGGNLAEDVTYSGTVSVAMEGTLAGIPSIAFSQCLVKPERDINWATAEHHAPEVISRLIRCGWSDNVLINVNFPPHLAKDIKGIRVTEQGRRDIAGAMVEERFDPRGFPYYWFGLGREVGTPGHLTDLQAMREGFVSVTPLHLDLTHHETRGRLAAEIEG